MVRRELANTVAEALAVAVADSSTWPWVKLRHLTLGPFCGFRVAEPFDLSNQVTLFYGLNGSGKISLCEALEYGLLGDVEEARNKHINARTYLANARWVTGYVLSENADANLIITALDMAWQQRGKPKSHFSF